MQVARERTGDGGWTELSPSDCWGGHIILMNSINYLVSFCSQSCNATTYGCQLAMDPKQIQPQIEIGISPQKWEQKIAQSTELMNSSINYLVSFCSQSCNNRRLPTCHGYKTNPIPSRNRHLSPEMGTKEILPKQKPAKRRESIS
jgi:hypothetical protein